MSYISQRPAGLRKLIEGHCQSCGKKVMVLDGFIGCIFCRDCSTPKHYTIYGKGRTQPKRNT
jgi:hypothetical protein